MGTGILTFGDTTAVGSSNFLTTGVEILSVIVRLMISVMIECRVGLGSLGGWQIADLARAGSKEIEHKRSIC